MKILVVPTIRENSIGEFLESWKGEPFDKVIIIEDNPTKTFNLVNADHYSWNEINEELKENSWIISRRDSSIRCFGFLMAYRLNPEYVFTLDDDCLRIPEENFVQTHINQLENNTKWTEIVPGMRTRGIPYKNKGKLKTVLNVGLWTNVPDLDALQGLLNPVENFVPPDSNRIIPPGQFMPMCGMNMCMKPEILPLMYFALMGEGYPYRRFDDIFCGIITKKICDHLKYYVSCGHPFVKHVRASNPITNLIKEAPGIELNETFWEVIDNIKLIGTNPLQCMKEIGLGLNMNDNAYLQKLGSAIYIWTSLFG